jgi:hypothetical protein
MGPKKKTLKAKPKKKTKTTTSLWLISISRRLYNGNESNFIEIRGVFANRQTAIDKLLKGELSWLDESDVDDEGESSWHYYTESEIHGESEYSIDEHFVGGMLKAGGKVCLRVGKFDRHSLLSEIDIAHEPVEDPEPEKKRRKVSTWEDEEEEEDDDETEEDEEERYGDEYYNSQEEEPEGVMLCESGDERDRYRVTGDRNLTIG